MKRLSRGELEARVMDVLWDADGWLTPGEVHATVARRRPLAYTTVMTILVRLWQKGMLERKHAGRAFAYQPVLSRDEWAASRMHEILESAGDPKATLSRFIEAISGAEKTQLRRLLARRRR